MLDEINEAYSNTFGSYKEKIDAAFKMYQREGVPISASVTVKCITSVTASGIISEITDVVSILWKTPGETSTTFARHLGVSGVALCLSFL